MSKLVLYDTMRRHIAACARVDEAKEIPDKAAALAAYARQRDDRDVDVWMSEIHNRVCIRIGQLSQELDAAKARERTRDFFPPMGRS